MSSRFILRATFACAFALFYAAAPASADILLAYTAGTTSGNTSDPGAALTISGSSGAQFNDLQFNWYGPTSQTNSTPTPLAFGTLYIFLASAHPTDANGFTDLSPANLSTTSTGFVGKATAASNEYSFASGVTLNANTSYYFFADSSPTVAISSDDVGSGSPLIGSGTVIRFRAPSVNNGISSPDFGQGPPPTIYDFKLTGTQTVNDTAANPEPSSLTMLGTGGLAWLVFAWRSRNRKKTVA